MAGRDISDSAEKKGKDRMKTGTIYLRSPAKINLSLLVVGRRADGFHELITEMAMIDLFDNIKLERTRQQGIHLTLSGRMIDGDPQRNLVVRALEALMESVVKKEGSFSGGFAVDLEKNIPVGAGLGGGSSNAAIVLWGGNRLLGTPLTLGELDEICQTLGSDVPFFLRGPRAMGVGRGERLVPLPPSPGKVLLWNPGLPLPTAQVYKALDPSTYLVQGVCELTEDERSIRIGSLLESGKLFNSLESPALSLCPQVGKGISFLEEFLPGNVRMTGSGPTVFARCQSQEEGRSLGDRIVATLGGWAGVFNFLEASPVSF